MHIQMKPFRGLFVTLILAGLGTSVGFAQDVNLFPSGPGNFSPGGLAGGSAAARRMDLRAVSSYTTVLPGQTFFLGLEITLADGWVYYAADLADKGTSGFLPATLDVDAGPMRVRRILWPPDEPYNAETGTGAVRIRAYKKRAIVLVELQAPRDVPAEPVAVTLRPEGQICGESCIPIQGVHAETTVRIGEAAVPNPAWDGALADAVAVGRTAEELRAARGPEPRQESRQSADIGEVVTIESFWLAIGVALLAGLTLNIMPCVLPVIPIRILGIVEMAGQSRRRFVTMGLAFVAGMMLFFVGIAAINAVLKVTLARGFDLNELFQLQWVRVALSMIVIALAANLFGVFHVIVPAKVAGLESQVQSAARGHFKSVAMGFMLAVLATPCSFAFLAAAMTYAQAASLPAGTVVILAVGVGMSTPHALLAAFPSLVDRLPKPGRWMELFKQGTGFVLLLVAVWLLGTLRGGGSSYPFWVIAWGVILVFSLWMWAGWLRYDAPWRSKLLVRGLAVVLAAGTGIAMLAPPAPPLLEPRAWSPSAVAEARDAGRVAVVKFTATWCTKCLQQDAFIFNTEPVAERFSREDVAYFKADVATADTPAARWLKQHGYGVQIPLTLVYPPTGDALPPLRADLTVETLLQTVDAAGRSGR